MRGNKYSYLVSYVSLSSVYLTGLACATDSVLVTGEFTQTHWASGMELVGGYADFCTEAKLATIGKAGGGVVHDAGGIDGAEELLGFRDTRGYDTIGMM